MVRPTYAGPARPIGYIEAQRAWLGRISDRDLEAVIAECAYTTLKENPGYVRCGGRVEQTFDGAGVMHCNLYLGFAPAHISSEPLDPHNLNDAPLPQPGQIDPNDVTMPLGYKETQFNRGT